MRASHLVRMSEAPAETAAARVPQLHLWQAMAFRCGDSSNSARAAKALVARRLWPQEDAPGVWGQQEANHAPPRIYRRVVDKDLLLQSKGVGRVVLLSQPANAVPRVEVVGPASLR